MKRKLFIVLLFAGFSNSYGAISWMGSHSTGSQPANSQTIHFYVEMYDSYAGCHAQVRINEGGSWVSYAMTQGANNGNNSTWSVDVNVKSNSTLYYFEGWDDYGASHVYDSGGGSNYSISINPTTKSGGNGNWNDTGNWCDGTVPSSTTANFVIAHNLTLNQAATVGSLTINSDATFTSSDATARTLTITKSTSGSSTTLSNSGTWANGSGGSTVVFTGAPVGAPGSGDAIHTISGTIAFQNITVNKTSGTPNVGVSFGSSSSVSGTMEIGSGGFVSTAPPTSFYGANAILKFNQGSGATYDVASSDYSWSTTEIPHYITITSGTVNLKAARTASGDLLINGGILSLSAVSLTVGGNLTNSTGNTGLVIVDGGTLITNGSVSGGATVSRTISGPQWHLMSAPVTLQDIFTGYTDMYAWDEANNLWLNKTGGTFPGTTYLPGKGYLASWAATTTTKEFAGTLNSGDYRTGVGSVPALTYTVGKGNGYNLLGNPYPSALTGSISSWTKTNVDASIWVFDNGNYLTWNGITGTLTNGIIPAMQGFWVKANAFGASLTIPNTARTTSSQAYYKSSQTLQDVILLNVAGNGYNDGIVVNFNNQASSGYDGDFDVRKMMGDDAAPQLYCLASGEKLSIDVLPYSTKEVVVPVNLKVGKDENYTISVKENTFVPTVSILLEDTKTSQTTNLQTQSNYSFSAAVTDSPDRFRLHFGGALGIKDNAQNNPIRIYSANNSIYVANTTGNMIKGKLFVYNLMGQQLMQQELGSGALTKVNLNCSTGYYLVKVVTSDNAYSGKVFLQ